MSQWQYRNPRSMSQETFVDSPKYHLHLNIIFTYVIIVLILPSLVRLSCFESTPASVPRKHTYKHRDRSDTKAYPPPWSPRYRTFRYTECTPSARLISDPRLHLLDLGKGTIFRWVERVCAMTCRSYIGIVVGIGVYVSISVRHDYSSSAVINFQLLVDDPFADKLSELSEVSQMWWKAA